MFKKIGMFFLLFTCVSHLYAGVQSQPTHADIVNNAMNQFISENHLPGAVVLLYVDGKPETYYFGYAKPNEKVRMNPQTIFEVGSLSKVITSLLLAQAVDGAKLQLNASVKKYLPNLSDDFDEISLKQLATHTSGLPMKETADFKNQQDLNHFLGTFYPDYTVDEKWVYSNLGIGLLGAALEKATHKSLNELYINQILLPLGMQPIGIHVPKNLEAHYAAGYDKEGNEAKPLSFSFFEAAGAVKASAADMQRFLSAAIGLPGTPEHILYPMRMTESVYVELPTKMQGLGWDVHPLEEQDIKYLLTDDTNILQHMDITEVYQKPRYSGDMLIDKTGGTDGFRSYIAVIPNKSTGIVILTNKFIPGNAIARKGREILFELNHIEANDALS